MFVEDYVWFSAAHHYGLVGSETLSHRANTLIDIGQAGWSDWLAMRHNKAVVDILERNIEKGLSCGNDDFIGKLEQLTNCSLHYRGQGRPFKRHLKGSVPFKGTL